MSRKRSQGEATPDPPGPKRQPARPGLSSRHRKTLAAIFERPTRGDIPWRNIERLFEALGGSVATGRGSRRRVELGNDSAVFHEPHPEKVTDKGAVVSVRGFLMNAGVEP